VIGVTGIESSATGRHKASIGIGPLTFQDSTNALCMISRFRHEVVENCTLLGYAAASSYLLKTFRDHLSVPSSGVSGFGGLDFSVLTFGTQFAGLRLAEAVGFLGRKKSSARLPSDGK
jgi:hypothetical protein